jgi:hypothetical protein
MVPVLFLEAGLFLAAGMSSCDPAKPDLPMRTITDQLGREVTFPVFPERIAALHHFGGKIVFALNRQHLLVEKSIYVILISGMSAIMTRRKRFQIIFLNWSVMRQTLGFRNWRIGIDFFDLYFFS